MNNGTLEHDRVKSEFGLQNGDDFDLRDHAIDVGVRDFACLLPAMNGEITHFHPKTKRSRVKTAQIDSATGNAFQLRHHAVAHHGLKRIRGCVPGQASQQEQADEYCKQQVLPELAPTRSGAGFRHCAWPPE